MNVLSLFDGVSVARIALDKANIAVKSYYACEIDKYATAVSTRNYPDIIRLGDVLTLDYNALPKIDLLVGGSPCTDLSIAKKNREGLKGSRSSLFWEYVKAKNELNPTWFILENVASMSKTDKDTITEALGVEPVLFDASLVSAQSRKRLFWTNIRFDLPTDKGILLKDILQPKTDVDDRMIIKSQSIKNIVQKKQSPLIKVGYIGIQNSQANRVYSPEGKTPTLSTNADGLYQIDNTIRKLTPIECERLQGLPDNYTAGISNTQRYKCCGNAFNADVVATILQALLI